MPLLYKYNIIYNLFVFLAIALPRQTQHYGCSSINGVPGIVFKSLEFVPSRYAPSILRLCSRGRPALPSPCLASFLIRDISQSVPCNVPGTWYDALSDLFRRPPQQLILTWSFFKMLVKKKVECPNDPPVLCTACQPLSRKSSTHKANQCVVIKILICYLSVFTWSWCWV